MENDGASKNPALKSDKLKTKPFSGSLPFSHPAGHSVHGGIGGGPG